MKMNSPNKEIINIKQNNSSNSIDFNSAIMEKNEFDMIHNAIKEKMNKKIKELKKLYQATKDGGDPDNFHKLCDGISNTLVLYKSAGNRRFGGFTSQSWKSQGERIPDKNCFLFSLDKKKIYHSNKFEIPFWHNKGPTFCIQSLYIIQLYGNALKGKRLKTNEAKYKSFFGGDENALSEDGKFDGVFAKDYEVFQIIFE